MGREMNVTWLVLYWTMVACGVFIILCSFFLGVEADSPQPVIIQPSNGLVHQIPLGSQLKLICRVSGVLPGGEQHVNGSLSLWWCDSTVAKSCYETTPSSGADDLRSGLVTRNVTGSSAEFFSNLTREGMREEAGGLYFCAAWAQESGQAPRTANITVEISVPTADPAMSARPTVGWTSAPMSGLKSPPVPMDVSTPGASTTDSPASNGVSPAVIAAIIIVLILVIVTIVVVVWFYKYRKEACFKGRRIRARGSSKNESFTSDGGINGFGMSPVQAEMQPFIMRHRCDIFIHHHGTDLTLAEMMRSKLLDQESHLHVTLWSEIAGTGRESRPSTKRLALSLVHSTTVVLLVSWKYLQHESQRFRLALSRIPRKIDTVRGKVVIVRRIEEEKVPQDLKNGIANSLEYNVDTDSKFFWPRFNRAVVPQRDDMLYWRT